MVDAALEKTRINQKKISQRQQWQNRR